uniref:Uncharacterized protein n=1 Tax=Scleropages formosus TaxID=113540 RepID=A0A8C9RY67_SCLFO
MFFTTPPPSLLPQHFLRRAFVSLCEMERKALSPAGNPSRNKKLKRSQKGSISQGLRRVLSWGGIEVRCLSQDWE